jgi:hypothetical protein
MSPELDKRIPAALLILRFFLATFLLQWSIEKLILPGAAARIASNFYRVTLPVAGSYALGVADQIRAGDQPQNRQGARARSTRDVARPRRRSD